MNKYLENVITKVKNKYPEQKEYIQAVEEILSCLNVYVDKHPEIEKNNIIERFINPDRIITFKVVWEDDNKNLQVNTGYRVQFNSTIGPYKGGLRFHPSVNESIVKFLGLEQCLKNSLTSLPMGGGKGGSDFDPKGKSDTEIRRFCQAFMLELSRHIGQFTDVPAGDIGVGSKEIGYLFGYYKKIKNEYSGVLTGKGLSYGGSKVRKEATGYGLCYFASFALNKILNTSLKDKTILISGSGNVAIYALEKAIELGGKVLTMSDSNGYIYDQKGIDLEIVKKIKEEKKGRIKEYLDYRKDAKYIETKNGNPKLFSIKADIVLPCATQNEIDLEDAKIMVQNKVIAVFEGANMPTSLDAINYLIEHEVLFGPAKASNAGGVAVSGLEMMQNSIRKNLSYKEVDKMLFDIMEEIFNNVYKCSKEYASSKYDLLTGANIAGFEKIAKGMLEQGI